MGEEGRARGDARGRTEMGQTRRRALIVKLALVSLLCASTWYGGGIAARAATGQIFLPNVTKTFGGPQGWTTPVAIQNVGTLQTTATVTAYRFKDGASVATIATPSLKPGQAWVLDPLAYPQLPNDTQFSLVVQAAGGGQVTATVIEGQGASWMAYSGVSTGAGKVFLPNITRRLGGSAGWETPFVVQNIGTTAATISVSFYGFADGNLAKRLDNIKLEPGRAKDFVPFVTEGLTDDRQYAVVVDGGPSAQLYAIVNEVQGVAAMSYEGILSGAQTVYLPNIVKFFGGREHWSSPFIVQNVGASPATFSISFYPFYGATQNAVAQIDNITLQPGRSYADDVRFAPANLPPGQYSVVIRGAPGSQLAAVVNQVEFTTGMALSYDGITSAAQSSYLPYIQKDNGAVAWNAPIIAQNVGSAPSDITVTIFDAAGTPVTQKAYPGIAPGAAVVFESKLDRRVANGVFSALVQSAQPVASLANHYSDRPGDYGMSFTGTPGPQVPIPVVPPLTRTVGGYTFTLTLLTGADLYTDTSIAPSDVALIATNLGLDFVAAQDFMDRRPLFRIVPIYVFATRASFVGGLQSVLGSTPQRANELKNSRSVLYLDSGAIAVNWEEIKTEPNPLTWFDYTMRFQLTRAIERSIAGNNVAIPAWVYHGAAALAAATTPNMKWIDADGRYTAASMANGNFLFTLQDLTSETAWDARTGDAADGQVWQAVETVRLLRADIGAAGLNRLLDLLKQGKTFADAYFGASGKKFDDFAAGVPARLKALASSYPGIAYAQDQPDGVPGLFVIAYGLAPNSTVALSLVHQNGQTYASQGAASSHGTFGGYLPLTAPAGQYFVTIAYPGPSGSIATLSISATKP